MRGPRAVIVRLAAAVLAIGLAACGGGSGVGSDGGGAGAGGGGSGGGDPTDGGFSSTVSCTITQAGTVAMKSCIETSGLSSTLEVQYLRMGCTGPLGDAASSAQQQFALGPCSHDQAIGGCATPGTTGLVTTRWWYADGVQTADDDRALCQTLGDTFVAP